MPLLLLSSSCAQRSCRCHSLPLWVGVNSAHTFSLIHWLLLTYSSHFTLVHLKNSIRGCFLLVYLPRLHSTSGNFCFLEVALLAPCAAFPLNRCIFGLVATRDQGTSFEKAHFERSLKWVEPSRVLSKRTTLSTVRSSISSLYNYHKNFKSFWLKVFNF